MLLSQVRQCDLTVSGLVGQCSTLASTVLTGRRGHVFVRWEDSVSLTPPCLAGGTLPGEDRSVDPLHLGSSFRVCDEVHEYGWYWEGPPGTREAGVVGATPRLSCPSYVT